jgi:hypothetical protein
MSKISKIYINLCVKNILGKSFYVDIENIEKYFDGAYIVFESSLPNKV